MRKLSIVALDWWDYTTLDDELVADVAKLTADALFQLSRDGFRVVSYDTLGEFYLAEALEYIEAWSASTPDNPVGICGPIGPTEQLPLVARLVNSLGLNLAEKDAHFWGMDEWVDEALIGRFALFLYPPDVLQMSEEDKMRLSDPHQGLFHQAE